jgi:murein DD-endopeptidase MepM/ murein hydrolase activator NlpD
VNPRKKKAPAGDKQRIGQRARRLATTFYLTVAKAKNRVIKNINRMLSVLKRVPRPVQIFSLYIIVMILAGGIFIWRTVQLNQQRHTYPFTRDFFLEENDQDYAGDEDVSGSAVFKEEENGEHKGGSVQDSFDSEKDKDGTAVHYPDVQNKEAEEFSAPGFAAVWPVNGVKVYGFRDIRSEKIGDSGYSYYYSRGMALTASPGSDVQSIWNGTVVGILANGYPYGRTVLIERADGLIAVYGALNKVVVQEADSVTTGQIIGDVAEGIEPDPALVYLEIRDGHKPLDPEKFLPPLSQMPL